MKIVKSEIMLLYCVVKSGLWKWEDGERMDGRRVSKLQDVVPRLYKRRFRYWKQTWMHFLQTENKADVSGCLVFLYYVIFANKRP